MTLLKLQRRRDSVEGVLNWLRNGPWKGADFLGSGEGDRGGPLIP